MTMLKTLRSRSSDLASGADEAVRYLSLNVLWAAVSLTVVGAPAATVAVHAVIDEWGGGDARPVATRFFAALREHGARATMAGTALAVVAALVVVNAFIAGMMGAQAVVVLGILGAVALTAALLATALPAVLRGTVRGILPVVRAAFVQVAVQPVSAIASLVVVVAIAFSALAFPPSLLLLPAPCVRLIRFLRSGRRVSFTPPRTRSERTYA